MNILFVFQAGFLHVKAYSHGLSQRRSKLLKARAAADKIFGKVDADRVDRLKSGSIALRSLLRLKISDDADLDTARRSVMDVGDFFRLLSAHAETVGQKPFEILQTLAQ